MFRLGRRQVGRRDAKPPFRRVVPRRRLARTRARTVTAAIEYFDGTVKLRRTRRLSRCGL
ncbi:MAG TPA: hypothetical protein VNT32_07080 [Thermoleophilaceae bacterium]|nr:hypothetical protein [Thermoleophilaceae bacterium]